MINSNPSSLTKLSLRVLSMGQTELNCVLMLNWIVWIRTVFDIETAYLCWIKQFEIELFWHLTVWKKSILILNWMEGNRTVFVI